MKNSVLVEKLTELMGPTVEKLNYELYHIEYIKENKENYLRIYIDSENGISLEDCEKVSRAVSDILDEKDPIEDSYYLEVSSPGVERILYTDKHMSKYVDNDITIKLETPFEGNKTYEGTLISFNDEIVTIKKEDSNLNIPKDRIKKVILKGEF